MQSNFFTMGPAEKNDSTKILESLIHNLLNENIDSTFSMVSGELIIEQKIKGEDKSLKHNITLLLETTHIPHINFFSDQECDVYIKKTKAILQKNNDSTYDSFFVSNERESKDESDSALNFDIPILEDHQPSLQEETQHVTPAHKLAVNYYTRTFDINPFIRGRELSKFSVLYTENQSELQHNCFMLLTSAALIDDFLRRQQSELRQDPTYTTTEVKLKRGLRIEIFRGEAPIFNELRKLSDLSSQSVTKYSTGFTSYSEDKLTLEKPGEIIDYHSDEHIPVFHAQDDLYILIHKSDSSAKSLSEYSQYKEEHELLAEQEAKEITVLNVTGNIFYLQTEHVLPLNVIPSDNYKLQLALRYIYENFLKKPFTDLTGDDLEIEFKTPNGPVTIFRNNHGLAHSARQAIMVDDLLPVFLLHAKPELQPFVKKITDNPNLKQIIQIAASFLTVGRTNDKSEKEDPAAYTLLRSESQKAFNAFVLTYYPKESLSGDEKNILELCSRAILDFHPLKLLKLKFDSDAQFPDAKLQATIIYFLLYASHMLDIPRVPGLWLENEELGKKILNAQLYNKKYGIFSPNNTAATDLNALWELSVKRLQDTGDRILDRGIHYDPNEFIACSHNPAYVSQTLGLTKPLPTIIRENKPEPIENKLYFDTIIYLLSKSIDPDAQIEIFQNEAEFSDLLYFAGLYLISNRSAVITPENQAMLDKIQESFNSAAFQEARNNFVRAELTPAFFGESIEELPHVLKTVIPTLREQKLDNPDNIRQLLQMYREHPTHIYHVVQDLRYAAKNNQLNAETFQLMCLLAATPFDGLMKLLENYTYNPDTPNIYASFIDVYSTQVQLQKPILFSIASNLGRLDLVTTLLNEEADPTEKMNLISSNYFLPLTFAVKNQHKSIIKLFFETMPAFLSQMMNNIQFYNLENLTLFSQPELFIYLNASHETLKTEVFKYAATRGCIPMLKQLYNAFSPALKAQMVGPDNDFDAFKRALLFDQLNVMKELFILAPEYRMGMLAAESCKAAKSIPGKGLEIDTWLLAEYRNYFSQRLADRVLNPKFNIEMEQHIKMELRFLANEKYGFSQNYPKDSYAITGFSEIKRYLELLFNILTLNSTVLLEEVGSLLRTAPMDQIVRELVALPDQNHFVFMDLAINNDMLKALKDNPDVKKMLAKYSDSLASTPGTNLVKFHFIASDKTTSSPNNKKPIDEAKDAASPPPPVIPKSPSV